MTLVFPNTELFSSYYQPSIEYVNKKLLNYPGIVPPGRWIEPFNSLLATIKLTYPLYQFTVNKKGKNLTLHDPPLRMLKLKPDGISQEEIPWDQVQAGTIIKAKVFSYSSDPS